MRKTLEKLGGHAGVLKLTNGNTANYGGIRVQDENFIYYSGKGLREMWPQNANEELSEKAKKLRALPEADLIAGEYIKVTPISQIAKILS